MGFEKVGNTSPTEEIKNSRGVGDQYALDLKGKTVRLLNCKNISRSLQPFF